MSTFSDRTRSNPRKPQAEIGADQLRYEQISVLASRASLLGLSSITASLLLLGTFWSTGLHCYLIGLVFVIVGAHGLATFGSRRWLAAAPRAVSRRMAGVQVAMTAIIAARGRPFQAC